MFKAVAQCSALQFTRRQTHAATLERYGLIRKFFLRQVNTPAFPPLSVSTSARIPGRLQPIQHHGHHVPYFRLQGRFVGVRGVHTTNPLAQEGKQNRQTADNGTEKESPNTQDELQKTDAPPNSQQFDNYSKFFRNLAMSLPHLHRPTRDDFLNAATGFWSRLRIRFKWLTIRSFRKYNADDISAFITWFFMSQTLWLFVGTCVSEPLVIKYFIEYTLVQ